ncbi:MAG: TonB family protein [Thermoanaerobaculia bacterium]
MHDAVADVLAERGRPRRGALSATVLASVALHVALFGAVVVSARRATPPQRVSTLNIRFAPTSMTRPAPAVETPAPPMPETKVQPPPVVEKETPPPEKKEAYAPKQESIFGRSEKEVAPPEPRPAPPAPAVAPPVAAPAIPAVGTAGVTGFEGGDFPFTIYVDQMLAKIGRSWFRPQTGGEPLAKVYFVIERNGRIREAEVIESSGHGAFDRAAKRAVLDSSPLAPLPLGYRGTWLGVHLTFH